MTLLPKFLLYGIFITINELLSVLFRLSVSIYSRNKISQKAGLMLLLSKELSWVLLIACSQLCKTALRDWDKQDMTEPPTATVFTKTRQTTNNGTELPREHEHVQTAFEHLRPQRVGKALEHCICRVIHVHVLMGLLPVCQYLFAVLMAPFTKVTLL